MNMQFDGIAEFVAVAQLGSFTAAADQLGITKSAVGRAVSRLEARLGAKLLHLPIAHASATMNSCYPSKT